MKNKTINSVMSRAKKLQEKINSDSFSSGHNEQIAHSKQQPTQHVTQENISAQQSMQYQYPVQQNSYYIQAQQQPKYQVVQNEINAIQLQNQYRAFLTILDLFYMENIKRLFENQNINIVTYISTPITTQITPSNNQVEISENVPVILKTIIQTYEYDTITEIISPIDIPAELFNNKALYSVQLKWETLTKIKYKNFLIGYAKIQIFGGNAKYQIKNTLNTNIQRINENSASQQVDKLIQTEQIIPKNRQMRKVDKLLYVIHLQRICIKLDKLKENEKIYFLFTAAVDDNIQKFSLLQQNKTPFPTNKCLSKSYMPQQKGNICIYDVDLMYQLSVPLNQDNYKYLTNANKNQFKILIFGIDMTQNKRYLGHILVTYMKNTWKWSCIIGLDGYGYLSSDLMQYKGQDIEQLSQQEAYIQSDIIPAEYEVDIRTTKAQQMKMNPFDTQYTADSQDLMHSTQPIRKQAIILKTDKKYDEQMKEILEAVKLNL